MFGWNLFSTSLYKTVFYRQNSVDKSKQLCTELSASLVHIDTEEEHMFLYSLVQTNHDLYPDTEYWVDNRQVTSWAGNEPNNMNSKTGCTKLGKDGSDWKWKVADCTEEQGSYFICEKEVTTEAGNRRGTQKKI